MLTWGERNWNQEFVFTGEWREFGERHAYDKIVLEAEGPLVIALNASTA